MELFCKVIIGSSVIYMEPIIGKVAKTETLHERNWARRFAAQSFFQIHVNNFVKSSAAVL